MAKAVHFPRVEQWKILHCLLIFLHVSCARFSTTSPTTLTGPVLPSVTLRRTRPHTPPGRTRTFTAARQSKPRQTEAGKSRGNMLFFTKTAGETQDALICCHDVCSHVLETCDTVKLSCEDTDRMCQKYQPGIPYLTCG